MRAVIYEQIMRKRWTTLVFLAVAGLVLIFVGRQNPLYPVFLYLIFCMYYNGFFKLIRTQTSWPLLWSLPLRDGQILAGQAIAMIILGWGVNAILFGIARLGMALPLSILAVTSGLSLITDLFLIGNQFIRNKIVAGSLVLGWMALIYGYPLIFKGPRIEQWLITFIGWPWYWQIVPLVALLIPGWLIIAWTYRRYKQTYELSQTPIAG